MTLLNLLCLVAVFSIIVLAILGLYKFLFILSRGKCSHDWYVVMDNGHARWCCSRCGDKDW